MFSINISIFDKIAISMNLAIFRYQIQLYYPTIPYFVIICSLTFSNISKKCQITTFFYIFKIYVWFLIFHCKWL